MGSLLEARNTVQWLPSESALPMRSVHKGSRVAGIFFLVLGTAAALGCLAFLITDATHSLYASVLSGVIMITMTGMFVVFGAAFAWVGLHQLVARAAITIRDGEVAVERTTVIGRERWREALDHYLGVSRSFTYLSGHADAGGGSSHARTCYEIHLRHPAWAAASCGNGPGTALPRPFPCHPWRRLLRARKRSGCHPQPPHGRPRPPHPADNA